MQESMQDAVYEILGPKSFFEMTSAEVREAASQTDLVLVAVGSTEQHGPHLPLGTDALQGAEFARRTALRLAEDGIYAVVGPTIPFGNCPYHMPFPGTINISNDTLRAVIKEVCQSLVHHGFTKIALIIAHGGNWAAMQTVAQEVVADTGAEVLAINFMPHYSAANKEILTSKDVEGHAGEGETSRGLALHPELVQLQRARIYSPGERARYKSDHPLLGGGVAKCTRSYKALTPVGSVGNPTLAAAETGEKSFQAITEYCANIIKRDLTRIAPRLPQGKKEDHGL